MTPHHTLPAEFNIYGVSEQHALLLACLDGLDSDTLTLAGGDVAEVDTSAMQLLVALAHECRARGLALRLLQPAAALSGAMAALGLGAFFDEAARPAGAAS